MFATISTFGWVHTLVSLSAIGFGLYAFVKEGRVNPAHQSGKWYLGTMLFGSVTAFGFFSHGFTPGHVLSLVTLILLLVGTFATRGHWLGRAAEYVQTLSFSASYLLLMVFTTTETLTRVPAGQPFANGPNAASPPGAASCVLGRRVISSVGGSPVTARGREFGDGGFAGLAGCGTVRSGDPKSSS